MTQFGQIKEVSTNTAFVPESETEQVLTKRLDFLNLRISQAEEMESVFVDRTKELLSLEDVLNLINNEKGLLLKEISELQKEVVETKKVNQSIKEEIKSSSKELDLLREDYLNICQEQTKKSESLKALEGKFNRMKIEFDLLESKSKVSQEDFDKEIITRDILIQNLEKEAVRLTTLNKENLSALNSLEDKIVSSRDECDVLQNNLSILRKKERAGREEVESLSVEVAKLKENFCKQEAEHKEQIAFAEKELEKREGLVSQRESWIISKEASLREMKVELEKFHGKPITSLNI